MRAANTYRAARRNVARSLGGALRHWPSAYGIQPGRYPLQGHNAAMLKAKAPKPTLPGIIPPILVMMVARGLAAGTLAAFPNRRKQAAA